MLETIASDPELQKAEILFLGSYGRACEFLTAGDAEVGKRKCASSLFAATSAAMAVMHMRRDQGKPASGPARLHLRIKAVCQNRFAESCTCRTLRH